MRSRYNIFISHAWTRTNEYDRIKDFLMDSRLNFADYSVPSTDPLNITARTDASRDKQLEDGIRNQISHSSVVIIIGGMFFYYRKWIQKEFEIAQEMDKPIVVVKPYGNRLMPIELKDKPNCIYVNWNGNSIREAVKEAITNPLR
ncbi:TIR domain-containing protein [Clostridium perfringens]|uniref:TIR domain-containing protein n=1 Tax=Clostridium perfringens TaxID=1502 RepID=UPI001ABB1D02|nr:TIR domain-containing protein [Clostridium perfringens]MBO3399096.1 TIR domain-containing protein [Clostridium perfringens]